jgi:hypothetical protein
MEGLGRVHRTERAPEKQLYALGFDRRDAPLLHGARGSILHTGWKALAARGLREAYEARLAPEHRSEVLACLSTDWVPFSLLEAHEHAFDQLDLSRDDARLVGVEMSRGVNGVVYATLARLAGQLGASPWLVFGQANKTWQRLYAGGAVAVFKRGERNARIEVWGNPLARYRLHREAFAGALVHVLESYCEEPTLTESIDQRTSTSYAFHARW